MEPIILDKAFNQITKKKHVHSALLRVERGDGRFVWEKQYGECKEKPRYFIASTTKLYITNMMLQLQEKGLLNFDDLVIDYLDEAALTGLIVYQGKDYKDTLTIKHLLSNTSGIPDYFFHKQPNGKTIASALLKGQDTAWTFSKTIENVKSLKPKFYPGMKRKAAYSDTNYTLLGAIIEKVTHVSINEALKQYIFDPLNLKDTYAYAQASDESVSAFYYRDKRLWLPNYMMSITSEGGLVSTAEEACVHLKAFFNDTFFDRALIEDLKDWRIILPPPSLFYYGIGLEKLIIPSIMTGFVPIKDVLGFWGQTGAFSFYHPKTDLYFTGTANQINGSGHSGVIKAMITIIKAELKQLS